MGLFWVRWILVLASLILLFSCVWLLAVVPFVSCGSRFFICGGVMLLVSYLCS